MTGIRQSFAFCRERNGYNTGIASNFTGKFAHYNGTSIVNVEQTTSDHWIAPPPGSYFSHTSSRGVQRVQTTGSKFWDAQAYGQVIGSWEWTFVLNHEYIEPFLFVFEDIGYSMYGPSSPGTPFIGGRFKYYFFKRNSKRVKSFTVRIIEDDKMVGTSYAQEKILKGCVVKDMRISKGSGQSTAQVTLSGFYASESITYSSNLNVVPVTVYREASSTAWHTEWMSVYAKRESSDTAYKFMANTDDVDISLDNSAQAVYSVASPFSPNFAEGLTKVGFSSTMYYTDPREVRTFLMSNVGNDSTKWMPKAKGMRPLSQMVLLSTNCTRSSNIAWIPDGVYDDADVTSDLEKSEYGTSYYDPNISPNGAVDIILNEVAIKSIQNDNGDNKLIQDKMSSVECRDMSIVFRPIGPSVTNRRSDDLLRMVLDDPSDSRYSNLAIKDRWTLISADTLYNRDNNITDYGDLDGWFAHYSVADGTIVNSSGVSTTVTATFINKHAIDADTMTYTPAPSSLMQTLQAPSSGLQSSNPNLADSDADSDASNEDGIHIYTDNIDNVA